MQEIETRFLVDEADLERIATLERIGRFVTAKRRDLVQSDCYFDTPDRYLAALGGSLRMRRKDGESLFTLKLPLDLEAGRRLEFEEPAGERSLEAWLQDLAEREEVPLELRAGPLLPVLEIENRRTALDLRSGEERIEAALDRVSFRGPGGEARGTELELELKAGDERSLAEVAAALQALARLSREKLGKYARAVRQVGGER